MNLELTIDRGLDEDAEPDLIVTWADWGGSDADTPVSVTLLHADANRDTIDLTRDEARLLRDFLSLILETKQV